MGRGFGITAHVDQAAVREVAREAERLGYSSFWVNDMPEAEGLVALAAAAEVTAGLELGVGVLPLDQRPPEAIIDRVRALGLPLDRLVLGVGSGAPQGGLARVRAGVDVLREELGVTVVVGALGPRMSMLAGQVADGVLFNWVTPEYAERAGRWVLDGTRGAGRARVLLMAYVRCGLLPGAGPRLEEELARYDGVPQFDRHLDRMGVDAIRTGVLAAEPRALLDGIAAYEPLLDETIVRAVTRDDTRDSLLTLLQVCAP